MTTWNEDKCDNKATRQLNWPGWGVQDYCEEHYQKARSILGALGV